MLFHEYHLYDVCTKYKLLILSLDRRYTWSSVSILDIILIDFPCLVGQHSLMLLILFCLTQLWILLLSRLLMLTVTGATPFTIPKASAPFSLRLTPIGPIVHHHTPILTASLLFATTSITSAVSLPLARGYISVGHVGGPPI